MGTREERSVFVFFLARWEKDVVVEVSSFFPWEGNFVIFSIKTNRVLFYPQIREVLIKIQNTRVFLRFSENVFVKNFKKKSLNTNDSNVNNIFLIK